MTPATLAWLSAFLFTQAVEVPVYLVALHRAAERAREASDEEDDAPPPIDGAFPRVAAAFGASLITHPIVWFVIPRVRFGSYEQMVLAAESFAVAAEALYFWGVGAMDLRRAFLWSLLANGASVTLGLTSRHYFGWP